MQCSNLIVDDSIQCASLLEISVESEKSPGQFVKQYVKLSAVISDGLKKYKDEVEKGIFPDQAHSFSIKDEEIKKLKKKGAS